MIQSGTKIKSKNIKQSSKPTEYITVEKHQEIVNNYRTVIFEIENGLDRRDLKSKVTFDTELELMRKIIAVENERDRYMGLYLKIFDEIKRLRDILEKVRWKA